MAVSVVEDTISGQKVSLNSKGEFSAVRTYLVSGLDDVTYPTGPEKIVGALQASGIPSINSAYPLATSPAVVVRNVDAKPEAEDNDIYRVTVTYGVREKKDDEPETPAATAQISMDATLQQVQTNKDINDDLMGWTTDEIADPRPDATATDKLEEQGGVITKFEPQMVFRFTRNEETNPVAVAQSYVGTVNNASFIGAPAGTMLCTAVNSASTNEETFTVNYQFQYKPDGWKAVIGYIDKSTGTVIQDATLANDAIKEYEIYEESNFSTLGLV